MLFMSGWRRYEASAQMMRTSMAMTMSAHQGEYGSQVKLMIADITAMTTPAMRAQV